MLAVSHLLSTGPTTPPATMRSSLSHLFHLLLLLSLTTTITQASISRELHKNHGPPPQQGPPGGEGGGGGGGGPPSSDQTNPSSEDDGEHDCGHFRNRPGARPDDHKVKGTVSFDVTIPLRLNQSVSPEDVDPATVR